jgi:telomerase reverse transcriptase
VDFAIWYLFFREINEGGKWPKHLLCDGYRTKAGIHGDGARTGWTDSPGIYSLFPNDNVAKLKSTPWPQLSSLLGQHGELVMLNLLVDTSIYMPVQAGSGNVLQLSGGTFLSLYPDPFLQATNDHQVPRFAI